MYIVLFHHSLVTGDKKILKIVDGKVDSVSWNRDVRLILSVDKQ